MHSTIPTSQPTDDPVKMALAVSAMAELSQVSKSHRRQREEDGTAVDIDVPNSNLTLDTPSKKRKRPRKIGPEKKFECKYEGCGKSYSRAEHLYRHQLNHTPKQIYRCDFPDCYRSFVRQDLCVRHRERHTTKGSQLQKRDHFAFGAAAAIDKSSVLRSHAALDRGAQANGLSDNSSPAVSSSANGMSPPPPVAPILQPAKKNGERVSTSHPPDYANRQSAAISPTSMPSPMTAYSYQAVSTHPHAEKADSIVTRSTSVSNNTVGNSPPTQSNTTYSPSDIQAPYGKVGSRHSANLSISSVDSGRDSRPYQPLSGPDPLLATSTRNSSIPYPMTTGMDGSSMLSPTVYASQQPGLQMPSLPVNGYQELTLPGPTPSTTSLGGLDSVPGMIAPGAGIADAGFDSLSSYAYPLFGGETYNRSPFAMVDDFAAWLFNESGPGSSPLNYPPTAGMVPDYLDPTHIQNPFYANDPAYMNSFGNVVPLQHPMSMTSILDPGSPQAVMSEEKRQELLDLISTRFNEAAYSAVAKRKDAFLEGNIDDDNHILSLRMMQTYIGSYWFHFHPQLPILHRPTFSADKTHNLLLLAIITIGASTLDNAYGREVSETASALANFISWHLRWEIFMDADFRPPAKLWVFQALLLLEVHEKMYATRALHERAHIHHDTTLTLMRRGSSLIDHSAFESPASMKEDRRSASGSISVSETTAEESWSHWIKAEATRRVAFAAFVLDSTHSTMFGHSAKMVAHELRLPLPCDEVLWSATSAGDVARVQASLHANGVKPVMFLEALKQTLNGQPVRTNAFGRTILMAGLLSVSWHMNQRDLQVSTLGVAQALGGRDKWRSALLRAFDNWRRDVDEALGHTVHTPYSNRYPPRRVLDEDNIVESRDALHRLAHMALHVDIMDCQIFAGARRLLGRSITPKDYKIAKEKMTQRWAAKASARDAVFYALKFLSECLLGNESDVSPLTPEYCARDDYLVNRPWVLYFAALVVWCYGYALEGPINPPMELPTPVDQRRDMQEFLWRVGGVREPNELETLTGRNRCMGLLMVLRDDFMQARWELLAEGATLLESCIEKLSLGKIN